MQGIQKRIVRSLKSRYLAGFMVLAMFVAILAGCATQGKVKPPPRVQPPRAAAKGLSVSQLHDGRQGFVITEAAHMNSATRRDFENAVVMFNEAAYDKAIELLKKVIEQSPGVTAPYINLGMAYQRIDKTEQAEAQFKTALQLVPGHPVACNQYGLLFRRTGRFDEARKLYEQALEHFPDYYPVRKNLGILCDLYLNDLESALRHYEIYRQAVPGDKNVKLWIADLRNRLGKNRGRHDDS